MQSLFSPNEFVLEYPKIYGISTSMRNLKMGYCLSNDPDLDVYAIDDIKTYDKESEHGSFHITFLDDDSTVLCIRNKGSERHFYPRFKKVDYLLCSLTDEEINKELIQCVAKLRGVSLCFALDKPNNKEILNFSQLQ